MATFQVQLNGSNFVSEERQRKFQETLKDNHSVVCLGQDQVSEAGQGFMGTGAAPGREGSPFEAESVRPGNGEMPDTIGKPVFDLALDHSFALQSRMMELHQQYLAQQAEYIQLITTVLNQQGKVLDLGNGTIHADIIETFQRTLDHFHTIREGDMKAHQEFLTRQAEFSDRLLKTLESGSPLQHRAGFSPAPARAKPEAEPITREPHIAPGDLADPGSGEAVVEKETAVVGEVPAAAPKPPVGISSEALSRSLLEIVGEKTGYPPDVLEPGLDLEADLGIDSIKRVEILGALEERYPNLPPADTQALAQTRTLQEIVDYMSRETAALSQQAEEAAPEPAPGEKTVTPAENPPAAGAPQDSSRAGVLLANLEAILLEIVGEKTGYPVEVLELGMDMEADLGIDSIKRVEILGTLEERVPDLPPADTQVLSQTRTLQEIVDYMSRETSALSQQAEAAAPEPAPGEKTVTPAEDPPAAGAPQDSSRTGVLSTGLEAILLEVVGEKTGYPVEVLELGMDMEADLGIDSIKRVEILASMEERVPGLPAVEAEVLAELRTLGQIVNKLGAVPAAGTQPVPPEVQQKKKADQPEKLEIKPARLAKLPEPDRLEIKIPRDRPLIVSQNGTPAASGIFAALQSEGWNVVVWNFPDTRVADFEKSIPAGVSVVHQEKPGKENISATLEKIRRDFGIPTGFIHLHPLPDNRELFSEREEMLIKQVFLLAGCIKPDLEISEQGKRNMFLAVTSTGGKLGLNSRQTFQEGGSLAGLIKSLHWEWPGVFCRALDFNQEMEPDQLGRMLIKEIHDPDAGLLEVGFDGSTRVTIIRDEGSAV